MGRGPHIEDTGRDGYDIRHLIDTVSDAGSYRAALNPDAYCRGCGQVICDCPDAVYAGIAPTPLKGGFDAVEGRDNPEALPPVSAPFHSSTDSSGGQP